MWESGAILEYLVDTYDKENKLDGENTKDKWLVKQFLMFQMSGQGPYFGQMFWYNVFEPESIPSAKKRYADQTDRVLMVLDKCLEGKEYLVGGKW